MGQISVLRLQKAPLKRLASKKVAADANMVSPATEISREEYILNPSSFSEKWQETGKYH
jgi:hypothetical protein